MDLMKRLCCGVLSIVVSMVLVMSTMPVAAYADMGESWEGWYYDYLWRGTSWAHKQTYWPNDVLTIVGTWTTWTKIKNATAPAYWLRNRTNAYINGAWQYDQVVSNSTAYPAGQAIVNTLVGTYHDPFIGTFSTYSTHALYHGGIGVDDGYFATWADENSGVVIQAGHEDDD